MQQQLMIAVVTCNRKHRKWRNSKSLCLKTCHPMHPTCKRKCKRNALKQLQKEKRDWTFIDAVEASQSDFEAKDKPQTTNKCCRHCTKLPNQPHSCLPISHVLTSPDCFERWFGTQRLRSSQTRKKLAMRKRVFSVKTCVECILRQKAQSIWWSNWLCFQTWPLLWMLHFAVEKKQTKTCACIDCCVSC